MKINKKIIIIALVAFLGSTVPGLLLAEESDNLDVSFLIGYRLVDTDGVEAKYREDINLEQGPRLFRFKLEYKPEGNLKKYADKIDLRLANIGGDPFESLALKVEKYGKYQFRYDRRKSSYYYSDILEGHDFHSFDFDRINDSGFLKVWLGSQTYAYMDYNHWTKKGSSVTTYDFNRVEFEFDKPIDEKSSDITLGLNYNSKRFSIVLEEKIQDYENANSLFLPGYADGGDYARYPSALYFYSLSQPYDMKGNTHSVKFSANPFDRLLFSGSMQIMKQDTDITYSEAGSGIDYLGSTYLVNASGEGDFTRKIQIYDLDATYLLSDKLAVIAAVRYSNFDQTGSFTNNGETTPMALTYENGGIEAGIQYQPSTKLGITVGYRFERRDVEDEVELKEENGPTDRSSIFGNLKWRPSKTFTLSADYQNGTYKNPFTLTSPTDYHRFRLTAKLKVKKFYASGSYLLNKTETDSDGNLWEANKNQFNLRFGYHCAKVKFSAGYALIDMKREGDRLIAYPPSWSGGAGTFPWEILYEGTSNLFDIFLYYQIEGSWGIGGYFNAYKNTGSWELSRTTLKGFLKYTWANGLITNLSYRLVDFKEKEFGYNDYKANIFEISFGYQW